MSPFTTVEALGKKGEGIRPSPVLEIDTEDGIAVAISLAFTKNGGRPISFGTLDGG